MTKIQMIIAKDGDVLNFDHVKSVYLRCDNPKDNAINWTYSIMAKTGDDVQTELRGLMVTSWQGCTKEEAKHEKVK